MHEFIFIKNFFFSFTFLQKIQSEFHRRAFDKVSKNKKWIQWNILCDYATLTLTRANSLVREKHARRVLIKEQTSQLCSNGMLWRECWYRNYNWINGEVIQACAICDCRLHFATSQPNAIHAMVNLISLQKRHETDSLIARLIPKRFDFQTIEFSITWKYEIWNTNTKLKFSHRRPAA